MGTTGRGVRTLRLLAGLAALCCGGAAAPARAAELGALEEFHVSVREAFDRTTKCQVDNYVSIDAYRILGKVDFHSQFLVTNDFNLTDAAEAQLTLAYLNAEGLLGHWDLSAGRQFFSHGFDAYIGDGVRVRYRHTDALQASLHVEAPFDAESQPIEDEPILVYGGDVRLEIFDETRPVPLRVSAQVERRDHLDDGPLDQILLGAEAFARFSFAQDTELYADVEYEIEEGRLRRVQAGSRIYPLPRLVCNLEVERFDPDRRFPLQQAASFFQDTITNLFARSAVVSGSFVLDLALPAGRDLSAGYSVHAYTRGRERDTFGHNVNLFFDFLSLPACEARAGCGYSGIIAGGDSVHLGVLRAGVAPFGSAWLGLLAESGVLDSVDWRNEWILHLRATFRFVPFPNLETSLVLEENRNPYFDTDFRAILFCKLLLGDGSLFR